MSPVVGKDPHLIVNHKYFKMEPLIENIDKIIT